jgi:predicted HTH transcriptional regulator
MAVLQEHEEGISRKNLREILRISNETLGNAIKDLLDSCKLINSDGKLLCNKYAT